MCNCGILSGGCVALAAGLTHNTTLQELGLSSNGVGVEGAVALREALAHNKTLRKLWLSHDESLQEEGVDCLIATLHSNTTLQNLCLPSRYKRPAEARVEWF